MNFRIFKNVCLAVAGILAFSSCSVDDDGTYYYDNAAHGIIGNASPNSGDLYFFADGNQVNSDGLNYGSAVGYYNFFPGDRTLTLKSSDGAVLDTYDISLAVGNFFTAFAVNTFDNVELVVYEDVLAKPDAGKARVRFINLSPDAEAIDVFDSSIALTSGLTFKQATPFMDVVAGTYNFDFRLSSDDSHLYTKTINLNAGRIYTFYTKGFVTPAAGSNDTFTAEGVYNY